MTTTEELQQMYPAYWEQGTDYCRVEGARTNGVLRVNYELDLELIDGNFVITETAHDFEFIEAYSTKDVSEAVGFMLGFCWLPDHAIEVLSDFAGYWEGRNGKKED